MIDFQILMNRYPTLNKHYLNKYKKLLSINYSEYSGKSEKHHILPKSLFPELNKCKENHIYLPLKAHYLAHWILAKLLPDNTEMNHAFFKMSNFEKYGSKVKSSKFYEVLKSKFIEDQRQVQLKLSINKMHHTQIKSKNGTHPITKENYPGKEQILNGTHWFFGENGVSKTALRNGTHNFQSENHPEKIASREGRHKWAGDNNYSKKWLAEGTHHFSGERNPSYAVKPWNNFKATTNSKYLWSIADKIYELHLLNPSYGYINLGKLVKKDFPEFNSVRALSNVIRYFKSGWIPKEDPEWVTFKDTHNE